MWPPGGRRARVRAVRGMDERMTQSTPPEGAHVLTCATCGRTATVDAVLDHAYLLCKGCGEPLQRPAGRSMPGADVASTAGLEEFSGEEAPAGFSARADWIVAACGGLAVLGMGVAFLMRPPSLWPGYDSAVAARLARHAQAFRRRALEGPHAGAWIEWYQTVALHGEDVLTIPDQPRLLSTNDSVRILAMESVMAIPGAQGRGGPVRLLMVAYAARTDRGRLPTRRAAADALAAFTARGEYQADGVTLVHWAGNEAGGRARSYAVDFTPLAPFGVAVVALEPAMLREPDQAVAFARGDVVGGEGYLISRWAPVPKSEDGERPS